MIKKLKGITLLELMLVLAIAATISLLSIRQYTQYRYARDAFSLKYNVDLVFQAMRNYYYANCAESGNAALAPSQNPSNPFSFTNIMRGSNGYLDPHWRPANPLVDPSFSYSGYDAQFNNVTFLGKRNENFCYYYPGTTQQNPDCASLPHASAIVYLWVAQVVVKVKDAKTALGLKGLTGANCALDSYTPSSIVNCSTALTSEHPVYLVWQHLPSFASPEMSSGLWNSAYGVKQFNLQYTNDPFWGLVSGQSQYFLCGG